jgi:hypothetical protein
MSDREEPEIIPLTELERARLRRALLKPEPPTEELRELARRHAREVDSRE